MVAKIKVLTSNSSTLLDFFFESNDDFLHEFFVIITSDISRLFAQISAGSKEPGLKSTTMALASTSPAISLKAMCVGSLKTKNCDLLQTRTRRRSHALRQPES